VAILPPAASRDRANMAHIGSGFHVLERHQQPDIIDEIENLAQYGALLAF
jgi:hypothetical protein